MNERIKELAEQAGFGSEWFKESLPGYPALPREGMLKELTELIVKECCDMFVELRTRPADLAVKDVKKHFGVEL